MALNLNNKISILLKDIFKNQIIERDLNMLRISNGVANKIN